jgi:hypothetical protein
MALKERPEVRVRGWLLAPPRETVGLEETGNLPEATQPAGGVDRGQRGSDGAVGSWWAP